MKWHPRTMSVIMVGTVMFGARAIETCWGVTRLDTWLIVVPLGTLMGAFFGLTVALIASLVTQFYLKLKP